MHQDTKNLPTLKEIEKELFHQLQQHFQTVLLRLLEEVDVWLMENRDHQRFAYKEKQASTLDTMFGSITFKRRKYVDRQKHERIALLDHYLQFKGSDSLSPLVAEMAVEWAVRGPSYRDARDRLQRLLGYQALSHEQIRQKVLQIKRNEPDEEASKEVEVLFLEVDGIHASLQQSDKGSHEVKTGVIHEGWEKRHPGSKDYKLKNKSYFHSMEDGETFWESFSHWLYKRYDITENTHVVINGDGARWIRAGVSYFPNAIYVYDRYHLKKWIKQALGGRSKQERRRVYKAAEANDPTALLATIAEAEKAETDEEKQKEIADLREFVLNHQEAFQDYRERLKEKGVDTSWMRPMGAAESNMNFLSKRLKKMGYSWSLKGLEAMTNAKTQQWEGTLTEAVGLTFSEDNEKEPLPEETVSLVRLLKQKTRQSVGAALGRLPALAGRDQNKPFATALRGLAGLS